MKNLFTLIALLCFTSGMVNAQDKAAFKPERITKIESKETLKASQIQPKKTDIAKIERRAANVKRIDSNNSKGIILTEEQVKARATATKAKNNLRKGDEK